MRRPKLLEPYPEKPDLSAIKGIYTEDGGEVIPDYYGDNGEKFDAPVDVDEVIEVYEGKIPKGFDLPEAARIAFMHTGGSILDANNSQTSTQPVEQALGPDFMKGFYDRRQTNWQAGRSDDSQELYRPFVPDDIEDAHQIG